MLTGKIPGDDYTIMELLSKRYGWTPQQIRKQNMEDIEAYLQIIKIRKLIEQKQNGG